MTGFELNPRPKTRDDSPASMLLEMMRRAEIVSLEKRDGRWGLFYSREAALLGPQASLPPTPLGSAPLEVRERFLNTSEEFFRKYLAQCEGRLGTMKASLSAADRTLDLLRDIRLE